jgi:hypothetical protein
LVAGNSTSAQFEHREPRSDGGESGALLSM